MTKGEINSLYAELDKLLSDICKFLDMELRNDCISPDGRSIAKNLIQRSKQQLQTISTTLDNSDNTNESYVDMQGNKANQEDDEPQEVYSFIEGISLPSSAEDDHIPCPFANLPATEIRDGKTGQLYRKEKKFFFEQQKKIYAAILESWLLIYMNESSAKPCQTFDLTRYEARPAMPIKDMKKREETFDLFHAVDSKSYHFIALTAKDAMQWIAAINRQNELVVSKRSLPPVPDSPTSPDSSNNYEPLKYQRDTNVRSLQSIQNKKKLSKQPLPLPPRNSQSKVIQKSMSRMSSEDSLSSTYDSVGRGVQNLAQDNSNSFSEDDSDTHYDKPEDLKQKMQNNVQRRKIVHTNHSSTSENDILKSVDNDDNEEDEDSEETYDVIENKPNPTNTNSLNLTNTESLATQKKSDDESPNKNGTQKPKPTLKPKTFSFRQGKR